MLEKLERDLADCFRMEAAAGANSGTHALGQVLLARGIRQVDAAITTSNTYFIMAGADRSAGNTTGFRRRH